MAKEISNQILEAFQSHSDVHLAAKCECRQNGKLCEDRSCRNREMGVECSLRCVQGCKNRRLRKGIVPKLMHITKEGNIGLGVKVRENVCRGDIIAEYKGEHKTKEQYREEQVKNPLRQLYSMESVSGFVIDASNTNYAVRYINESCSPNCTSVCFFVDGIPRVAILANRFIKTGEFLSYSYNMEALTEMTLYDCACRKIDCINRKKNLKVQLKNKKLPCSDCGKVFSSRGYLRQHAKLMGHVYIQPYQCKLCSSSFSRRIELELHMKVHLPVIQLEKVDALITSPARCENTNRSNCLTYKHDKGKTIKSLKSPTKTPKPHKCHLCKKSFNRKSKVRLHLLEHDSNFTVLYCSICPDYFFKATDLKNHTDKHQQDTKRRFPCPKCSRMLSSKRCLSKHLLSHEVKQKRFQQCANCGKTLPTLSDLQHHIKIYHPDGTIFECEQCNKKFRTKNGYNSHTQQFHADSRPSCDICKKLFYSESSLNMHKKTVHNPQRKIYRCHVEIKKYKSCRRIFFSKDGLRRHIIMHREIKSNLE